MAILSAPRGILWDLDNTLYRMDDPIIDRFGYAVASAALECGAPLTFDAAMALGHESFIRHRSSLVEFRLRYNIPERVMHHAVDRYLDHNVLTRCDETCALFAQGGFDHALITHAARPWALGAIDRLGLARHFPPARIFAYEDYDFNSKAHSRVPFETALRAIDCAAPDAMMVEDSIINLAVPRDMGLMTVFLHHGEPLATLPDYVDAQFSNARELLRMLTSLKKRDSAAALG